MRRYTPTDYEQMKNWYLKRGMKPPKAWDLPRVGFIQDDVGAGFLIHTDTPYAFIDLMISNPDADKASRQKVMDEIAHQLICHAKMIGFRGIRTDANVDISRDRARRFDFREVGTFTLYFKEL